MGEFDSIEDAWLLKLGKRYTAGDGLMEREFVWNNGNRAVERCINREIPTGDEKMDYASGYRNYRGRRRGTAIARNFQIPGAVMVVDKR